MFQSAILVDLLLAPSVLFAGLGVYAFLRSRHRLSLAFVLMMGLCAMLSLTYSYEVSAESMEAKIVWMQVKFLFAPFIPICWLAISMQLVGITHWFRPVVWWLLLIVPVLTPGFALTTQRHELFRHHFTLEPLGSLQILHFQIGPWMRAYTTYWHLVGLMGIVVLLAARRAASPTVRSQIAGLLAAYIIPAATDFLFHLGKTPIDGLNLAHVFLAPASLIAAWVVFHQRLLNLAPIARSALFDHMKEGVVVLDNEGRIADLNTGAERFLGIAHLKALGEKPETFGGPWPGLLDANPSGARTRIEDDGGQSQWVECSTVELFDERRSSVGRLCLVRDVTSTVLREEAVRQSEKKYRILVEKANEAISIVQDGTVIFANSKMEELLRLSNNEIVGKSFAQFVYAEDAETVAALYSGGAERDDVPASYDFRVVNTKGEPVWVLISVAFIEHGGKPATLALLSNIDSLKLLEKDREKLIADLQKALAEVKTLSGLIPICSFCKNIRDDAGYWNQLEVHLKNHSDAVFSHGICPECAKKVFPDADVDALYAPDDAQKDGSV